MKLFRLVCTEWAMKTCLSFNDILQVDQPQIDEMQRVGNSFPDGSTVEACTAFSRQVRRLEGFVVLTYGMAAASAKKADDLNEVAEIWGKMSNFCHSALQILANLKDKYSQCGTPELYDLVLDYKSAADKRRAGTLEEASCQKMELPKGLFPKLS
ncbi:MAG TPA: hypothetical protein VGN23_00535 [Verrucomicrobiae bacterium]|jgi:hypothetical protein